MISLLGGSPTFIDMVARAVAPVLLTPEHRKLFFDTFVQEVEERIKNVESRMLDADTRFFPWKQGTRCAVDGTPSGNHMTGTVSHMAMENGRIKLTISLHDGATAYKFADEVKMLEETKT
jgi:hypothetical protein